MRAGVFVGRGHAHLFRAAAVSVVAFAGRLRGLRAGTRAFTPAAAAATRCNYSLLSKFVSSSSLTATPTPTAQTAPALFLRALSTRIVSFCLGRVPTAVAACGFHHQHRSFAHLHRDATGATRHARTFYMRASASSWRARARVFFVSARRCGFWKRAKNTPSISNRCARARACARVCVHLNLRARGQNNVNVCIFTRTHSREHM